MRREEGGEGRAGEGRLLNFVPRRGNVVSRSGRQRSRGNCDENVSYSDKRIVSRNAAWLCKAGHPCGS